MAKTSTKTVDLGGGGLAVVVPEVLGADYGASMVMLL
jgi:hypothetical protein